MVVGRPMRVDDDFVDGEVAHTVSSAPASGVPRPLAKSYPVDALKTVPEPTLFVPLVTSLKLADDARAAW